MQLHGLSHQISVDELGFSEDGHAHAHQKLKKQESLNMLNVNFDKSKITGVYMKIFFSLTFFVCVTCLLATEALMQEDMAKDASNSSM